MLSVAHNGEVTSTHLAPPTCLLPRKGKKICTALTKSSKGAVLPCPQEKQRGSCTALTEKQRVAALVLLLIMYYRLKNYSHGILGSLLNQAGKFRNLRSPKDHNLNFSVERSTHWNNSLCECSGRKKCSRFRSYTSSNLLQHQGLSHAL